MNHVGKYFTALASAVASAALLSACGGGDAGAPYSPTASIGYAVDGYLKDASVKCDASGVLVKTDSSGFFRFPDGCSSGLTLTGGTNVDTNVPFTGTLKAPAGSKMVTPLTTLLVGGMTQSQVNASLGLPLDMDLTNTDPAFTLLGFLVNPDLLKKTLAVQQLLMQTTEAMAAFAGDSSAATRQAIYSEVAAAFAAGLKGGAKLNATATTVDLAVLKTLVTDAGTRLAASTTVLPAVKAAFAPAVVKAETFAAVIAGGLKAQAEILLNMANADVTTVTTAQQTDTKIKTAVTASGMAVTMQLPPTDAAVVAKATALSDSINGAGTGGGTGVASTLPITFDGAGVTYTLTGFGGAEDSTVVVDPAGGTNKVGKVIKAAGSQTWAGTTVSTGVNQSIATIPFTSTAKTMTVRVWSPATGIPVRLKVEDASDNTKTVETEATTTGANAWETLTFNFANPATGTAAFNLATTYNKASIFFNFGTAGTGETYYFDDVTFGAGSGGSTGAASTLPITFDGAGVTYTLTGFEGAQDSTLAVDPAVGTNMVGKVVRAVGGPWYGGTTVSTGANNSIATIPFTASAKTMSMRFYSPGPGVRVRMKVENVNDVTKTCETDAVSVGTGWETLTFNFANPGLAPPVTGGPTAPLDVSQTFNKVTVFFNVAAPGGAWNGTYYFDDIAFGTP